MQPSLRRPDFGRCRPTGRIAGGKGLCQTFVQSIVDVFSADLLLKCLFGPHRAGMLGDHYRSIAPGMASLIHIAPPFGARRDELSVQSSPVRGSNIDRSSTSTMTVGYSRRKV